MFKRKWRKMFILFASIFLLIFSNTAAVASEDVDVWGTKTITDSKKVWTIDFSQPLKESSIKNSTVYVEDENYRLVFTTVTLSSDKKSIIVTPRDTYQNNKTYRLNISKDVTSAKGKKLEKSIVMPFALNGSASTDTDISGDAISHVSITSSAFATSINVISNDAVYRVTANYKEMHYEGNNTYNLGMVKLNAGEKVKIIAYDMKGKRLFSGDYTVN